MRCGLENDAAAAELGDLLVRNGAFVNRYADKILLGCLYALGDSGLHFVGFAQAPAYHAVFVTDNDNGCEGERTATLGHFGNAVDGHKAVLEFEIACRFYSIVSFSHSLSEFEAGAAGSIS